MGGKQSIEKTKVKDEKEEKEDIEIITNDQIIANLAKKTWIRNKCMMEQGNLTWCDADNTLLHTGRINQVEEYINKYFLFSSSMSIKLSEKIYTKHCTECNLYSIHDKNPCGTCGKKTQECHLKMIFYKIENYDSVPHNEKVV